MGLPHNLQKVSDVRCFDGRQQRYSHTSTALDCPMHFSIYLPPQAKTGLVPVIYWLSGLTCTDENFVQKAGAQQHAAHYGCAIVMPDTSPRGDHVADDKDDAWDMGKGAGFYLNATQKPWKHHYQMYDYVVEELPQLINENFPVDSSRCSIMGHSMGGHGALTIALKNPGTYSSVSAFAPIVAPSQCPWGEKAFGEYLGDNTTDWAQYDTVELIKKADYPLPMLVDQGSADNFLEEQLKPELLKEICQIHQHPLEMNIREGYDHSYFFIATFIQNHFAFHAGHWMADQ